MTNEERARIRRYAARRAKHWRSGGTTIVGLSAGTVLELLDEIDRARAQLEAADALREAVGYRDGHDELCAMMLECSTRGCRCGHEALEAAAAAYDRARRGGA